MDYLNFSEIEPSLKQIKDEKLRNLYVEYVKTKKKLNKLPPFKFRKNELFQKKLDFLFSDIKFIEGKDLQFSNTIDGEIWNKIQNDISLDLHALLSIKSQFVEGNFARMAVYLDYNKPKIIRAIESVKELERQKEEYKIRRRKEKEDLKAVNQEGDRILKLVVKLPEIYQELTFFDLLKELKTTLSLDQLKEVLRKRIETGALNAKLAPDSLIFPPRKKSNISITNGSAEKCIVCQGELTHFIYKCKACGLQVHLKCALQLKEEGQGCFNCGALIKDLELMQKDPVVLSIEKLSSELGDLLTPDEILHKDLSGKFTQLKKEFQDELKHKLSYNFYSQQEKQIDLLFQNISKLNEGSTQQIDEIKNAQAKLFKIITDKITAFKQAERKATINAQLPICKECGQQAREMGQVFCERCGNLLT